MTIQSVAVGVLVIAIAATTPFIIFHMKNSDEIPIIITAILLGCAYVFRPDVSRRRRRNTDPRN